MNQSKRAGKSLIEMLVVISTVGTITGLSTTLLVSLLNADGEIRQSTTSALALSDLTSTFRKDVHTATAFELIEQENGLQQLQLEKHDGHQIRYSLKSQSILRQELDTEENILRLDQFRLDQKSAAIESIQGRPTQIILQYEARPSKQSPQAVSKTLRIVATVGKDFRFETRGETTP